MPGCIVAQPGIHKDTYYKRVGLLAAEVARSSRQAVVGARTPTTAVLFVI